MLPGDPQIPNTWHCCMTGRHLGDISTPWALILVCGLNFSRVVGYAGHVQEWCTTSDGPLISYTLGLAIAGNACHLRIDTQHIL